MNPSSTKDVHFLQMWVVPDEENIRASYEQLDINTELARGGLIPIASGRGHEAAISIRQKGAVLWGGRLKAGETVTLPDAKCVHLYVAKGGVELEETGALGAGDAGRLSRAGARLLTAESELGAELLVWESR